MFIIWYPSEFSRLHNLHPSYWNSLLYGLISSGENSVHFLQLMPFTIFHFFVYPSLLSGKRQYGMRSLLYTSTHDQQWESNPRPSDLVQHPIHWATCSCSVLLGPKYTFIASQTSEVSILHSCNTWYIKIRSLLSILRLYILISICTHPATL